MGLLGLAAALAVADSFSAPVNISPYAGRAVKPPAAAHWRQQSDLWLRYVL